MAEIKPFDDGMNKLSLRNFVAGTLMGGMSTDKTLDDLTGKKAIQILKDEIAEGPLKGPLGIGGIAEAGSMGNMGAMGKAGLAGMALWIATQGLRQGLGGGTTFPSNTIPYEPLTTPQDAGPSRAESTLESPAMPSVVGEDVFRTPEGFSSLPPFSGTPEAKEASNLDFPSENINKEDSILKTEGGELKPTEFTFIKRGGKYRKEAQAWVVEGTPFEIDKTAREQRAVGGEVKSKTKFRVFNTETKQPVGLLHDSLKDAEKSIRESSPKTEGK